MASAAHAQTLYFSAIPDEDETALETRFSAVAKYLADELAVDVAFVSVKSYPAAVTAFRNDQIQLAWFGGLSGVQARLATPGARAIAQGVEDGAFVTYFIANTATGIAPGPDFPADALAGRTFTFGAQTSTSGRLMPEFWIREETGQSPRELFSRVGFSGDHSQTLRLVASGAWDVGALNYAVYDKAVEDGAPEIDTTTVIWRTPPYPDYNWTIRGDLDERFGEGFSERLTDAILELEDPEILAAFPRSGFVPASNADYAPIEETARALDLIE
ncbi:putative selenate ABC transporter substrate-binding protein [Palleronia sp. LCG004]|uniref:putative selenate ABC transporter substrate-binding protein n=1 Tax=Palleronia sp. LCG004 TaxID=3079304 RepID=UPI002942FB8F|nr:putative selenate ABC transporter substrate-binding protein [Palleronia sp. LCG004]WOI58354.1 putative selenate ABC transporter substrate-binding protein [Palleronia sp. LCG004]